MRRYWEDTGNIMMESDGPICWLVVWNIFYFPINIGNNHPDWLSYFSEGWPNHQPVTDVRCWPWRGGRSTITREFAVIPNWWSLIYLTDIVVSWVIGVPPVLIHLEFPLATSYWGIPMTSWKPPYAWSFFTIADESAGRSGVFCGWGSWGAGSRGYPESYSW